MVGVPDDEWGEEIAAAVVARAGRTLDTAQLRDFVRAELRGSKTPRTIVVVETLPRTDTGKLLRRSLAADLATDAGRGRDLGAGGASPAAGDASAAGIGPDPGHRLTAPGDVTSVL